MRNETLLCVDDRNKGFSILYPRTRTFWFLRKETDENCSFAEKQKRRRIRKQGKSCLWHEVSLGCSLTWQNKCHDSRHDARQEMCVCLASERLIAWQAEWIEDTQKRRMCTSLWQDVFGWHYFSILKTTFFSHLRCITHTREREREREISWCKMPLLWEWKESVTWRYMQSVRCWAPKDKCICTVQEEKSVKKRFATCLAIGWSNSSCLCIFWMHSESVTWFFCAKRNTCASHVFSLLDQAPRAVWRHLKTSEAVLSMSLSILAIILLCTYLSRCRITRLASLMSNELAWELQSRLQVDVTRDLGKRIKINTPWHLMLSRRSMSMVKWIISWICTLSFLSITNLTRMSSISLEC